MRKRKIVKAVYKLIYWSKKSVHISFFLTFIIKNATQVCMFYKCPCKFLFLVNVLFSPSWLLYGKYFSSFWLDCKQVIIILMLCCDVFMFLVIQGVPSDEDLEWLSLHVERWKVLGRRLRIEEGRLLAIDTEHRDMFKKAYQMLRDWKIMNGSAATYRVLHDALCHPLVSRRDLAQQLSEYSNLPQFTTGNMSLILQFNNNTITYKYSA